MSVVAASFVDVISDFCAVYERVRAAFRNWGRLIDARCRVEPLPAAEPEASSDHHYDVHHSEPHSHVLAVRVGAKNAALIAQQLKGTEYEWMMSLEEEPRG